MTLVDGEIQGIKGVYVKQLTPGGPADQQGQLRCGDKITSVNGQSTEGKDRHQVVRLVKISDSTVSMGVLRLKVTCRLLLMQSKMCHLFAESSRRRDQ